MMERAVELVLMPAVAFVAGLAMLLMMRRLAAKIQRRVGPPFFQPLYDVVKFFGKRTQISHGLIHDAGIVVALGGYIAAETLIPVPGMTGIAERTDVIVLIYFLMVPSLGMALAAGQCANPNASIGVSRALTAMLAYDIPFVIVIFGMSWLYGTTNLVQMVEYQQAHGWGLVQAPLLAVAGLFALQGMLGKQPFEIYVAPAEIATGPMVEMGGKYLGSLVVMQAFSLYTAGILYTTLFLGGGVTWFDFLLKAFVVVAIPMVIAFQFPRYRAEQMLAVLWKWPVLAGLLGLAVVML